MFTLFSTFDEYSSRSLQACFILMSGISVTSKRSIDQLAGEMFNRFHIVS